MPRFLLFSILVLVVMVEETAELTAKERRKEEQRFVCRVSATAAKNGICFF